MNGCVSKAGITADLESFKRAGLGGVQNFQVGGSESSLDDPARANRQSQMARPDALCRG